MPNRRNFLKVAGATSLTGSVFVIRGAVGAENNPESDTTTEASDSKSDGGIDRSSNETVADESDEGVADENDEGVADEIPLLPDVGAAEDWASYRSDTGNTSHVPREPDLDPERLDVAWEYEPAIHWDKPVVSDGTVYYTIDGHVHAVDALTGEQLWVTDDVGASGSTTVAYDTVVVGGENITAFDTVDGSVRWQREVGESIREPTVAYERVYYVHGNCMAAVSVQDGAEIWRYRARKQSSGMIDDEGTLLPFRNWIPVTGKHAYGTAQGLLHAVDPVTGEEQWVAERMVSHGRLLATDEIVILVVGDDVQAVDPDTGEEKWHDGVTDIKDGVAIDDTHLYWTSNIDVHAWRLETSEREWSSEAVGSAAAGNQLTVTEDTVFVPFSRALDHPWSESLVALDKTTGEEKWVYAGVEFDMLATIVVSGDETTPDTIYAMGKAIRNDGITEI